MLLAIHVTIQRVLVSGLDVRLGGRIVSSRAGIRRQ